ncbi:hypothetical protein K432DRAFT_397410 [Lepidopterella palustris CBS 459.81]|uniref:Uncharacterized protein n=1 Tax=Lepidopterella palustris CBS 459.81 TaxID=1314670 RepID=A0A8E2E0X4_9PEZI|nr:hypothetical protein K432DRAFT_397410 [Lepidopterella palustris CBS 459.81]
MDINNVSGRGQTVEATITTSLGCRIRGSASWFLSTSAKSIQKGDIICLLQGTLKPTVVRARKDYFTIVVIAVVPPKHMHTKNRHIEWPDVAKSALFIRDFVLIWEWETFLRNRDPDPYDALIRVNSLRSQHAKMELEIDMDNAIRIWDPALILGMHRSQTLYAKENGKKFRTLNESRCQSSN